MRWGLDVRRARMRGLQLQTAITLVATEKLSDVEIAEKLHVRLSALKEAMDEPYFQRRVAEMRPLVRQASHGRCGKAKHRRCDRTATSNSGVLSEACWVSKLTIWRSHRLNLHQF